MPCRFSICLALGILLLPGCAFREKDPVAARRHAYQRIIRDLEPGMTRRQLYALCPPRRTPTAHPPTLFGFGGGALHSLHTEDHPLDHDFSLFVIYRLANPREYSPRKYPQAKSIDDLLIASQQPWKSVQNLDDELAARPALRGPGINEVSMGLNGTYSDTVVLAPRERRKPAGTNPVKAGRRTGTDGPSIDL
jgi:hypothetical protein